MKVKPFPPDNLKRDNLKPTISTSSEEQLLQDAARIDSAAEAQSVANPLDQVIAGEPPGAPPPAAPIADPAIQQSLVFLVAMGTQLMTAQYRWDDPGDDWRNEVGRLGALLFDRYLPNFLAEQGELVSLVLLIGTYAGSNLVKTKTGGSHGDTRPTGLGKEHFISTDAPGPRSSNVGHS